MNNQFLIKRKWVRIGVLVFIIVWELTNPNITQGITTEELLKHIAELQAKIKTLQDQLAELEKPTIYEGIPAGFSFENNLKYGMKTIDVKYLQIILKKEVGPPTYSEKIPPTGYFGKITLASVIKFQEKYAQEILAPYGLTKGTGFVGKITRAKLNQLLGKKTPLPPPPFNFNLSVSPDSGNVAQGQSTLTTITVTLISGNDQPVTFSASGLPSGAIASFSPNNCNQSCSSALTIATASNTPPGTYSITITGTGGGVTKTTTFSLTVTTTPILSVSLSANPSSGNAPLNVQLTATISGITTGPANYIFYCHRSDPGTDVIPGYNKRVNYVFSNDYTYTCNYPSEGTFTAKVIVERGGLAAESRSTIKVTSLPFDFSLSVSPSSGTVSQGGSVSTTITANLVSGSGQPVSFSLLGLPSGFKGATASFSPTSCNPTCTSTLTISTSSSTPAGTYLITIGGTAGELIKTTTYFLTVTTPPTLSVSLSANPSSGIVPLTGVDLTATVSGTAVGTINYTFYCNRSDTRTDITPGYNHKIDNITTNSYTALDICNYSTAGTFTAKVIVERGDLVAESRVTITTAITGLVDLDVTFIERTPRYPRYNVCHNPPAYNPYLCGGQTIQDKRWPAINETVAFTAHVKNHGDIASPIVPFIWYIDDIQVKTGFVPVLSPEEEFTDSYQWSWAHDVVNGRILGEHKIKFVVDPANTIQEITKNNNTREDYTNALSFRFHVEQSLYDYFRTKKNAVGSYSWEDWAQYQIWYFQKMFREAVTSFAPNGIEERLRIDEIVIEQDNTLPPGGTHAPINWEWDGTWGFNVGVISMYENNPGLVSGPDPEWTLIHELGHQIGLIDGYNLDIQKSEVLIVDEGGNPVAGTSLMPFEAYDIVHHGGCNDTFPNCPLRGIMDAGPGNFTSHNVGSLNKSKGYRRGYYGEFLMDIPEVNKLKIVDRNGNPLKNISITIYQQQDNVIDNIPEYSGFTDLNGIWTFPTKNVQSLTTATGYTQRANPFGPINVVGTSSVFAIKLSDGQKTEFHWLDIFDFNVEYWKSNPNEAIYTIVTRNI